LERETLCSQSQESFVIFPKIVFDIHSHNLKGLNPFQFKKKKERKHFGCPMIFQEKALLILM
jgi:hypothetical protein